MEVIRDIRTSTAKAIRVDVAVTGKGVTIIRRAIESIRIEVEEVEVVAARKALEDRDTSNCFVVRIFFFLFFSFFSSMLYIFFLFFTDNV